MTLPPKAKPKFEAFMNIYEELGTAFQASKISLLIEISATWAKSFEQIRAMLKEEKPRATRSAIAAGMEQGLRDLPNILATLPEQERRNALNTYRRIMQSSLPNFFESELKKREQIIARGKIKNDREWYLLRDRVDEIEGNASQTSELVVLYKLLDSYEAPT